MVLVMLDEVGWWRPAATLSYLPFFLFLLADSRPGVSLYYFLCSYGVEMAGGVALKRICTTGYDTTAGRQKIQMPPFLAQDISRAIL